MSRRDFRPECTLRLLSAVWLAAGPGVMSLAAQQVWPWSGTFDDQTVSILVLGDINVQQRADPATAFQHVRETLRRADVVYANLEGLLVGSRGPNKDLPGKGGWTHVGPEAVKGLKAANVTAVGVANNVAYGRANIVKTLEVLTANGIVYTGAGRNIGEAHSPAIVERKGVRVGFLQYTARWYDQKQQMATASAPGIARIMSPDGATIDPGDLERLQEDVAKLRTRADIVIVSSHNRDGGPGVDRGAEANTRGEPYEAVLAHAAIDAGADLVFGHGSHVLQRVEVYRGKPILYCLGSFAFDWVKTRDMKDGLVVRLMAKEGGVLRVSFVPVSRDANNDAIFLDPSTGEGAALLKKVKDLSGEVPMQIDGREVVLLEKPQRVVPVRRNGTQPAGCRRCVARRSPDRLGAV